MTDGYETAVQAGTVAAFQHVGPLARAAVISRAVLDAALATGDGIVTVGRFQAMQRAANEAFKRLEAAEARCAELAAECDLLLSDAVLVSTQNRLAEAEELLREINAANFDARNLTVDDYEWRVSAFLAEGDT